MKEAVDLFVKLQGPALSVIGAVVSVWWFYIQRQLASQIEFDVDARVIKVRAGTVVEYVAVLKNKGRVRLKIPAVRLRVRALRKGDALEKHGANKLRFPLKLLDEPNMMSGHPDFDFTFLEPGITQNYRLTAPVPNDAELLLVYGEFFYRRGWPHTAERLIALE